MLAETAFQMSVLEAVTSHGLTLFAGFVLGAFFVDWIWRSRDKSGADGQGNSDG